MTGLINLRAGAPAITYAGDSIRGGRVTPITGTQQRTIHFLLNKTKEVPEHVWNEHFEEPFDIKFDNISMNAASAVIGYLKRIDMTQSMMRKFQRTEAQQIAWEMGE